MSKRVFLGVGHGGSDPGAVANGLKESQINLNVALEVDTILKAHNVVTQLSRYKEENDDLAEEIREANAFKPDVAVDIHVNAGGGDGFEVFHSIKGGVGKTLALNIEKEVKAIGQNSRGLKTKKNSSGTDYFGFIRSIQSPSIIVEMAFIDNINDIKDFDELHEQKKYALALAKGILSTLGISYKGTGSVNPTPPSDSTPYRIRKSWGEASTQKGAYKILDNAIAECKKHTGYSVYDNTGKTVFTNGASFLVKITTDVLNVRSGASTSYPVTTTVAKGQVYTIIETKSNWGKLKSGAGWICLDYTIKC